MFSDSSESSDSSERDEAGSATSGAKMVGLVRRAVESVQFGDGQPEPLEWETVVQAVATEQAEIFAEETAEAESCCVVFFTGEGRAQIALFYREGQPDGLIRDMRSLMRQMVQAFRRRNVVHVYAQVETANKDAERLLAVYRRIYGLRINSVMMHSTVEQLATKNGS